MINVLLIVAGFAAPKPLGDVQAFFRRIVKQVMDRIGPTRRMPRGVFQLAVIQG